jgi:hypothetical protein
MGYLDTIKNYARVGIGQGALLNTGDEIEATYLRNDGESYEDALARIRGENTAFKSGNPLSSTAAELGGMLLPGAGTVKGLRGLTGLKNAPSALTGFLSTPVGELGTMSAVLGGVAGYGASEKTKFDDLFMDTAKGVAEGGLFGAALGKMSPALQLAAMGTMTGAEISHVYDLQKQRKEQGYL